MKLQTLLMSLMFIFVVLTSALVSYSSIAITSQRVSPAASSRPNEMKSEGTELASLGFQVGNQ